MNRLRSMAPTPPALPVSLWTATAPPGPACPPLTGDGVANAHQQDLRVQQKHGVNYLRYWYDEGTGKVFCLVEAPSKDAAAAVHREAHGLVADEIIEVKEGA